MAEIFDAKTGKTLIVLPAFMAYAACVVLDKVRGGIHDYERRT
jgi:hypothetical protein